MIHYNKDNESLERKPALFVGADFSDPKSITDPHFDQGAYEDYLEEEVLQKVEEFKKRFLEMKDKALKAQEELAYAEIKVEEVVKQTRELE